MPVFMERAYALQEAARRSGFTKEYVTDGRFALMTYRRFMGPSDNVRIYIEGDGRAWDARSRLSEDPTPSSPVALQLAIADPSDNVAYIARPGQFPAPGSSMCDPTYWSQRRFAPEVVESMGRAIDLLKNKSGAKRVELIGYSGGGALAVLIAARRDDIFALRTVAGNLDPKGLCAYHNVSQLDGSMDPLDAAQKVAHVPQRHFIGSKDKAVPSSIAESFIKREGDTDYGRITVVEGVTHKDGWRDEWERLLSIPPAGGSKNR